MADTELERVIAEDAERLAAKRDPLSDIVPDATEREALNKLLDEHVMETLKKPVVKHDWQVKNCISYWLPIVQTIKEIQTPETIIIKPDVGLYQLIDIMEPLPDAKTVAAFEGLVTSIRHAGARLGFPLFMRTGTFSGKHQWKDTCFVKYPADIPKQLAHLIEDAACRDQCLDVFCARELLPTSPAFHAFHGDMPIVRELRVFVRGNQLLGSVPYWPEKAFEDQPVSAPQWRDYLAELNNIPADQVYELEKLSRIAGARLEGAWSVDWLWTNRGWYLTDCAIGPMSYGWNKEWGNP